MLFGSKTNSLCSSPTSGVIAALDLRTYQAYHRIHLVWAFVLLGGEGRTVLSLKWCLNSPMLAEFCTQLTKAFVAETSYNELLIDTAT